jgi:hypothetical protein
MSGLYYIISIIAVFIVIVWFVRNDGKAGTNGPLAMKEHDSDAAAG